VWRQINEQLVRVAVRYGQQAEKQARESLRQLLGP